MYCPNRKFQKHTALFIFEVGGVVIVPSAVLRCPLWAQRGMFVCVFFPTHSVFLRKLVGIRVPFCSQGAEKTSWATEIRSVPLC